MNLKTTLVLVTLLSAAGSAVFASNELKATLMTTVTGLEMPESAVYDPDQDVYFVSNINGSGTGLDNNGFISKIAIDGSVIELKFISGGSKGVILDGPKGITLSGSSLWVADIDSVREFDKATGKPRHSYDLRPLGALFLNDIAPAPDGTLYVTDSGLTFTGDDGTHTGPDRIFRIDHGKPQIVLQSAELKGPNGILWDPTLKAFLINELDGKEVLSWQPGAEHPTVFATGAGGFDGIAAIPDGRFLISSLDSSTVYVCDRSGKMDPLIAQSETPADIAFDPKHRRLLIPSFSQNRLQIWQIN